MSKLQTVPQALSRKNIIGNSIFNKVRFDGKRNSRPAGRTLRVTHHVNGVSPPSTAPKVPQIRLRSKEIFVSGVAADFKSGQMHAHLKANNILPIRVRKIKPKFDSYSSFIVDVSEIDYEKVFNSQLWFPNTIIKDYRERGSPSIVEEFPSRD